MTALHTFLASSATAVVLATALPAQQPILEVGYPNAQGGITWDDSSSVVEPPDSRVAFKVELEPGWWIMLMFHAYTYGSASYVDEFGLWPEVPLDAKQALDTYVANHPTNLPGGQGLVLQTSGLQGSLIYIRSDIMRTTLNQIFLPTGGTDELRWGQPILAPPGTDPHAVHSNDWLGAPIDQTGSIPEDDSAYLQTWQAIHWNSDGSLDLFCLSGMLDEAVQQQIGQDMLTGAALEWGIPVGLFVDVQAFAFRDGSGFAQTAAATPGLGTGGGTTIKVSDRRTIRVPITPCTRGRNTALEPDLGPYILVPPGAQTLLTLGAITTNTRIRFQLAGGGQREQPVIKVGPRVGAVRVPPNVAHDSYIDIINSFGTLHGASTPAFWGPMVYRDPGQ
ncbi:MAG: hypothetical protein AAF628_30870 [Planctomycetota bacterium]